MKGRETSILIVASILLILSSYAIANNIYVSYGLEDNGGIAKCDSSGNWTTFATDLGMPYGMAFRNGDIYASSAITVGNGRNISIEKFDLMGNRTTFASFTVKSYTCLMGLTFDGSGNLYASVSNFLSGTGGSIEKFDPSGNRTTFASGLDTPWGLQFDNNNNLYVSTWDQILKFDSSGNKTIFGSLGDEETGLAFDKNGDLFVAVIGGLINKFDSSGNSSLFAWRGLSGPEGIAFDSSGYLYVANDYDGRILKFDSSGSSTVFASGFNSPRNVLIEPVPEPATLLFFALGGLALRSEAKSPKGAKKTLNHQS